MSGTRAQLAWSRRRRWCALTYPTTGSTCVRRTLVRGPSTTVTWPTPHSSSASHASPSRILRGSRRCAVARSSSLTASAAHDQPPGCGGSRTGMAPQKTATRSVVTQPTVMGRRPSATAHERANPARTAPSALTTVRYASVRMVPSTNASWAGGAWGGGEWGRSVPLSSTSSHSVSRGEHTSAAKEGP